MNKYKVDALLKDTMTISDLYRWAVKNGVECLPIVSWQDWKPENDFTQIRTAELEEDKDIGSVVFLYW